MDQCVKVWIGWKIRASLCNFVYQRNGYYAAWHRSDASLEAKLSIPLVYRLGVQ